MGRPVLGYQSLQPLPFWTPVRISEVKPRIGVSVVFGSSSLPSLRPRTRICQVPSARAASDGPLMVWLRLVVSVRTVSVHAPLVPERSMT